MQNVTEKIFELAPPGGLFDQTVICNLFPDSSDVMSGEGYAIYVNGKLLAESKSGVPNRAGGQPRGGPVYAGMRGEFKGGKVTLAATSFLQFNKQGKEIPPRGHLTLWIEEQKLPPVE